MWWAELSSVGDIYYSGVYECIVTNHIGQHKRAMVIIVRGKLFHCI